MPMPPIAGKPVPCAPAAAWLTPDGKMADRIRAADWSRSRLGPPDVWPEALRVAVNMMLASRFPMFVAWGEDYPYLYNDACIPIVGDRHPQALGRPFAEIWPEVWSDLGPLLDGAMAGQACRQDDILLPLLREGEMRDAWFSFSYSPLRDAEGAVRGVLSVAIETTDVVVATKRRAIAETVARDGERELRALTDALPVLISAVDRDERYCFNNRVYEEWFGIERDAIKGRHIRDVVGDEAYLALKPTIDRALAGEALTIERLVNYPSGPRHVHIEYVPRRDGEGIQDGYHVLIQDIGERKRAEEHRELLVNELNHRVKNTLSVVQSLALQSFTETQDMATARRAFDGRLAALAAAHGILTDQNWAGASLDSVVDAAMGTVDRARVAAAGPAVALSARTAVAMALALHELATNAMKYGALSNALGKVHIGWTISGDGSDARLSFVWREEGGPPVTPPVRKGFGSRMLQRGLAAELRGTVDMVFAVEGMVCRIDAPLPAPE